MREVILRRQFAVVIDEVVQDGRAEDGLQDMNSEGRRELVPRSCLLISCCVNYFYKDEVRCLLTLDRELMIDQNKDTIKVKISEPVSHLQEYE